MPRSAEDSRRPWRRRALTAAAVLAVVAAGTAGTLALTAHGEARGPAKPGAPSAHTVRVERTDLANSQTLTGTLGYGSPRTLKGTGKGALTRLPKAGTDLTRGKPAYWVDDLPVMVFYGATPFFRTLDKPGVTGRDVTVLAENLRALGYETGPARAGTSASGTAGAGPGTPAPGATELTAPLLDALKRWQRDTGQPRTGKLVPGHAVVLPGPRRVTGLKAQLGDPADAAVLSAGAVTKTVRVKVEAEAADPIAKGDRVRLTLPDTKTTAGKVTSVGQVVQGGDDEDEGAGTSGAATVVVTVTPSDSAAVSRIEAGSVRVTFTTERRKNVLAVPVGALLALREGGYALQRPGGQLVGVKTGLFAKGRVEVSGGGIKKGDRVVTAS